MAEPVIIPSVAQQIYRWLGSPPVPGAGPVRGACWLCGEVLRWEVTPVDEDRSVVWEWRLTRPVSYAAVRQYALVPGSYAPARRGIRPPYRHPQMQRACVVPAG